MSNQSTKSKKSILIVDDSELNRALLSDMLSDDFNIIEVEDGLQAIEVLQEHELEISLILLDIVMPNMDGFEVLAMMNNKGWIKTIPVIMISAETGSTYIDRAYDLGAVDYISRPFDERTVKHRVMSNFMLALKQREISDMLTQQVYERERDSRLMVEILSHIVEFRNGESGLHILHVSTFTEMILKHLMLITDKYKLSQAEIKVIVNASALHDIGKMSVPEHILNKPGRLTAEEFEVMKRHAAEGANMLADIPYRSNEMLIRIGEQICRWHHERWDGRGYPDGLKEDEIPIGAQVVALADVYDALTSKRVYKDGYSHEKAIEMIQNGECGKFNPLILQCLDEIKDDLKNELHLASPGGSLERGTRENVEDILKTSGSDVSNRTVRLLEHERMKFKFFASLSREVLFEYVSSPETVMLTDFSAEYLELPEKIYHPAESEFGSRVFKRKDFDQLFKRVKSTAPESPIVEGKYLLNIRGEQKWNKVILRAIWNVDGEQPVFEGALGKCIDITEETEEIQQLEVLADKDQITSLLNARAAKRKISKKLSTQSDKQYALVFFDLDNLKKANDKHGHLFGNELIKAIADRMLSNTRASDICARFGGDEFVIFMQYKDRHQIDRIFQCLTQELNGFPVSVSMGIALSDQCDGDYDKLLHMADQAAYAVKYGGKNSYKFFSELTDNGGGLLNN